LQERNNPKISSDDLDEGTELSESFFPVDQPDYAQTLDNEEEYNVKRSLWPSSRGALFNPTMNSSSHHIATTKPRDDLPSPIKRLSHNLSFESSCLDDATSNKWNIGLEDTWEGRGRHSNFMDEDDYDDENNVFEIDKVIEEYQRMEPVLEKSNRRYSHRHRRDVVSSSSSSRSPSCRSNSGDSALPSYHAEAETLIVKRMLAMESRLEEIRETSLQSKHQLSSLLDIVVNKSQEDVTNTEIGQQAVKKLHEFMESQKDGNTTRIKEMEKEIESARREAIEVKIRLEIMEEDKEKAQERMEKMVDSGKEFKEKYEELEKSTALQCYELNVSGMKIKSLEEHIQFAEEKMEKENSTRQQHYLKNLKEKKDFEDQRRSFLVEKNKLSSINTELINQRDELLAEKKMFQVEIEKLKKKAPSHCESPVAVLEKTENTDKDRGGILESLMSVVSSGGPYILLILGTFLVSSHIISKKSRCL